MTTTSENRSPSELPNPKGETEVRDWHPDEQNELRDDNRLDCTQDQADSLQGYINQIKNMLGLENWDVFLTWAASSDDANASIHPVYGRHMAGLSVNKEWFSYTPEVQRNTILHELLHVVHNRQTEVIRTTPQARGMWLTFERETEMMVDQLATVLDQFFPYPPKPQD